MLELLSPAGNAEKLRTAIYFGANAVYFAGKKYGLRASCDNFEADEIEEYIKYCHERGVKAYITINIIAHNEDLGGLDEYIKYLEKIGADAIIAADIGIICRIREVSPGLAVHVSTQANVTNKYAAKFFSDLGVSRIILARELSISEIKEIRDYLPEEVELEAFVHGAMCISYSGRCLLSNYMSGRDGNRGQCVQACRWEYSISEKSRKDNFFDIAEDGRGTYILNSKDLNMLEHLKDLAQAGVTSFKIEGRMKSPYYVATVTNAYRRVLNEMEKNADYRPTKILKDELYKASHRQYTTGFNFKDKFSEEREFTKSSMPVQTHEFMALVLEDSKDGFVLVEHRNRFEVGDELEVLSPNDSFNKKFEVEQIINPSGEDIEVAKLVQEKLRLKTKLKLKAGDILRKKIFASE